MSYSQPEFFDPVEDCGWCSSRKILARHASEPLSPVELDGRSLPGRLWKLLYAVAA